MKRIIVSILLVLATSSAYAQIPVTVTSDLPAGLNHIQTMMKWAAQYQQMQSQIQQLQSQYNALTGSRGLGMIMNNQAYRDYLPSDWQRVYDAVKKGGYSGLSGSGKSVYDSYKVFDACANIKAPDQRTACEARAVKGSQDKGFALDAYNAAKGRITQIDQLMKQINSTNDPKAIAELQARIATEQANIQNEQTKLQMYALVAAAQDKVQQQQKDEIQSRIWASRKGIVPKPISFD